MRSREILQAAEVSFDKRSDDLDDDEARRIREVIETLQLRSKAICAATSP